MTEAKLDDENQMQLTEIDGGQDTGEKDSGSVVCVIVHEPTRKELARSVRSCLQHGVQLTSSDFAPSASRAKLARDIASGEAKLDSELKVSIGHGLVMGIDPDRAHVATGVAEVELSPVTHVVVNNLAALGESHAEIRDRVGTIVDGQSAELHLNDTGAVIDSETSKSVLRVLDSLDKAGVELQREASVRDVQGWLDDRSLPDRGRAPLGFEYSDGEVVPGENYDDVRSVLTMVLDKSPDGLSKRKAAEKLGVAPRTVGRAMDNLDRYGLGNLADSEE